jgi:hypothetical protein
MKKIEKIEASLKKLEEECAHPDIIANTEELMKRGEKMNLLQKDLDGLYEEWTAFESS